MNVERNYIDNGGGGGGTATATAPAQANGFFSAGKSVFNGATPSPADSGVMSPMTPVDGAVNSMTQQHLGQQQQHQQQQHYSPDHNGAAGSGYSPFNHPSPADSGCFNNSPYPMTSPSQNQSMGEGMLSQQQQQHDSGMMQPASYNPASVDSGCSYNSGSPYPLTSPNSNMNMASNLAEEFDAIQQPNQQQQQLNNSSVIQQQQSGYQPQHFGSNQYLGQQQDNVPQTCEEQPFEGCQQPSEDSYFNMQEQNRPTSMFGSQPQACCPSQSYQGGFVPQQCCQTLRQPQRVPPLPHQMMQSCMNCCTHQQQQCCSSQQQHQRQNQCCGNNASCCSAASGDNNGFSHNSHSFIQHASQGNQNNLGFGGNNGSGGNVIQQGGQFNAGGGVNGDRNGFCHMTGQSANFGAQSESEESDCDDAGDPNSAPTPISRFAGHNCQNVSETKK